MLKKILISLGVVVVAAGVTAGVLYFIKNGTTEGDTILDHSKDYGACDLLDMASIKTTLGEAANDLQQPFDMGIVSNSAQGEGVEDLTSDSQICVYAFKPGGTIENGNNSNDAFLIERIIYINESGPQPLIDQISANGLTAKVEGLGDIAFYNANDVATGPDATYSFRLEVFQDNTSVRYIIRQPAASVTFTAETAQEALVQLAQQAKQPS